MAGGWRKTKKWQDMRSLLKDIKKQTKKMNRNHGEQPQETFKTSYKK